MVRAMAPEFYESLPKHTSWCKVMMEYIMNPEIGAFSRVKRKTMANQKIKEE